MFVRMLAVPYDQNNTYQITMNGYQARKISEIRNDKKCNKKRFLFRLCFGLTTTHPFHNYYFDDIESYPPVHKIGFCSVYFVIMIMTLDSIKQVINMLTLESEKRQQTVTRPPICLLAEKVAKCQINE